MHDCRQTERHKTRVFSSWPSEINQILLVIHQQSTDPCSENIIYFLPANVSCDTDTAMKKLASHTLWTELALSNQKFIVVATSRMIGIHRSSVDIRRRLSSAFQSFSIISNAGNAAFPMLAVVGNARDSVL